MEWSVQISGDDFDIQELAKSLTSPELSITIDENSPVLRSSILNELDDAHEVMDKATEILTLLSGAARLAIGTRKPLRVGTITKTEDDGSGHVFVFVSETLLVRDSVSITGMEADGSVCEVHQTDPVPSWMALAAANQNIATVLRLLATQGNSWVNLYRILELIADDVGGETIIVRNGWVDSKTLELFKRTSNHPQAAGDTARHGSQKYDPPDNPMSLSEAEALINRLIHSWLSDKREPAST